MKFHFHLSEQVYARGTGTGHAGFRQVVAFVFRFAVYHITSICNVPGFNGIRNEW